MCCLAAFSSTSVLVRERKAHAEELHERRQRQRAGDDTEDTAEGQVAGYGPAAEDRGDVDAPLAGESVEQRHTGDREGGDQRGDCGQWHVLHQSAQPVEVLGSGRVEHGAGVEEQEALEEAMIDRVEQRAVKTDHGQRHQARVSVSGRQQRQAGAEAENDVADLADAVEGQQTLALFLLQRLHRADEQRHGTEDGEDHAPGRPGEYQSLAVVQGSAR